MKRIWPLAVLLLCLTLTSAAGEVMARDAEDMQTETEEETSFLNPDGTANYFVRTVNKEGKGIEGVLVQICSDRLCNMLLTDEEGTAAMTAMPYVYEAHILKAEGYVKPDRTFLLPENGGVLLLELEAE